MITEQMSMDQHKEMRFSDIKKVILTEAHRLHPANTVPEEDTTFYTSFPQFDPKNNPEQEHMIDQYYFPFLTAASISRRALSIATLCILCTLQSLMKSEENEITDMIKRLMMMILEGLVDKKSSKNFQSILWSQPKTRFNKWRRDPKRKAIVFKRPVFSDTEKQIVKPYLEILNPLSEEAQLMNRWFNLAVEPVKKFIYVAF
ncbi:hypothetical protein BDB01DRAFT_109678 [Pilobolus umbonatus]|nr:hypothetical protein BDB01DRAFT_109678 [Pilobolus umbonatus]